MIDYRMDFMALIIGRTSQSLISRHLGEAVVTGRANCVDRGSFSSPKKLIVTRCYFVYRVALIESLQLIDYQQSSVANELSDKI